MPPYSLASSTILAASPAQPKAKVATFCPLPSPFFISAAGVCPRMGGQGQGGSRTTPGAGYLFFFLFLFFFFWLCQGMGVGVSAPRLSVWDFLAVKRASQSKHKPPSSFLFGSANAVANMALHIPRRLHFVFPRATLPTVQRIFFLTIPLLYPPDVTSNSQ